MLEININEFKKGISEKINSLYLGQKFLIKKEEPLDIRISQLLGELFVTDIIGIYEGRVEAFEITVVKENNTVVIMINTETGDTLLEVLLSVIESENILEVKNVLTAIKQI